jgi:hypothetical protein
MTSLWAANRMTAEWAGVPNYVRAMAHFRCMSHVPMGKTGKQCSDTFRPPVSP